MNGEWRIENGKLRGPRKIEDFSGYNNKGCVNGIKKLPTTY